MPNAQKAAASSAVQRSKNAAVNRNKGMTVKAPMSAFGSRNAASSLLTGAALTEAHIKSFISIGCSAFAVKSPRS